MNLRTFLPPLPIPVSAPPEPFSQYTLAARNRSRHAGDTWAQSSSTAELNL